MADQQNGGQQDVQSLPSPLYQSLYRVLAAYRLPSISLTSHRERFLFQSLCRSRAGTFIIAIFVGIGRKGSHGPAMPEAEGRVLCGLVGLDGFDDRGRSFRIQTVLHSIQATVSE